MAGKGFDSLETIQVVVLVVVALMTQQHLKCVAVGIGAGPVQQLLERVVLIAVDEALGAGIVTHTVTDDGVVILAVLGIAQIQVGIQGDVKSIRQNKGDIALAGHGVAVGPVHVKSDLPQIVAARILGTAVGFTAVIHLVTLLVQDVIAVRRQVMLIDGIDGRNVAAVAKGVLVAALTVAVVIDDLVRTGDVQAGLEPGFGLQVDACATIDALKARLLGVAFLLGVAYTQVIVSILGATITTDVVLLAETAADSGLEPVEVVGDAALDLGIIPQLETIEQLVVGLVEDVVFQI